MRITVKVFHDLNPTFGFTHPDDPPPKYELVAVFVRDVDRSDPRWEQNLLDDAFRDTNHINSCWTHNPAVGPVRERIRSSSVGDIIQIGDRRHKCERFGWSLIEPDERREMFAASQGELGTASR